MNLDQEMIKHNKSGRDQLVLAKLFRSMSFMAQALLVWVYLPYKQDEFYERMAIDANNQLWGMFPKDYVRDRSFRVDTFWDNLGLQKENAWNDAYYTALWLMDKEDREWLPVTVDERVPWGIMNFLTNQKYINELLDKFRINECNEEAWKQANADMIRSEL
jgi:hypothetical protein